MSSDRERIIEFEASTSIPADGWFAIDSTTEGTRKVQKSAIIGSGSLDTTSQEVIGAINEVNQRAATIDSMTQDEYEDLPSTKESDNVPRFITDGVPTFDETLWNKVGTDPLDTTAQDCSGAINEIKQSLSNSTTSDFTLNSNVAGTTYFKYIYKYGNLKMINIAFLAKAISTIDTFYDLFTLPNGYTNIYEIEQLDLTRGKKTIDFKVTNGKVQIAAREAVSLNDLIIVKIDYI